QPSAEAIARLRLALHPVAVAPPKLVAGRDEPVLGPVEHVDRPDIVEALEILFGRTDGDVVEAVAVEVPDRHRCANLIAGLVAAEDWPELVPRDLREPAVVLRAKPAATLVSFGLAPDLVPVTVAVEVTDRMS